MRASEIFSPEEILQAAKFVVRKKGYRSTPDLGVDDVVQDLCLYVYRDKKPIVIPDDKTDTVERRRILIGWLKKKFKHAVERADFDRQLRRKKRAKEEGFKFASYESYGVLDEQGNVYNPIEPETRYFKSKNHKVTERDLQKEIMLATLNYMETCEADTPTHTETMRRDARVVRGFLKEGNGRLVAKKEGLLWNSVCVILSQFYSQVRWNYCWRVPCGLEPVYDIWFDNRRLINEHNERQAVTAAVTGFSKRVDTAIRCYNEGKIPQCIQSLNGIVKALQRLSLDSSLYMSEEETKTFDDASQKLYELVDQLLKTNQIEFSDDVFAPFKKV